MQMKEKLNRIAAFILSVCMALACMPMTALAEEAAIPEDGISVEVIPADSVDESAPVTPEDTEPQPEEQPVSEMPVEESEAKPEVSTLPAEEPTDSDVAEEQTLQDPPEEEEPEDTPSPADTATPVPEDETGPEEQDVQEEPAPEQTAEPDETEAPSAPEEDSSDTTESEESEQEQEEPQDEPTDDRHPLQIALDTYGHVYVATVRKTNVYSSPVLKADTLIYSTTPDVFLVLATKYTEHDTVVVWFLDEDGYVVKGFVSVKDLDDRFLLDEDAAKIDNLPMGEGMTVIGQTRLFVVNGTYAGSEAEAEPTPEPLPIEPDDTVTEPEAEETEQPEETNAPDESSHEAAPEDETPSETPAESEEPQEEPQDEPASDTDLPADTEIEEVPAHAEPGAYIGVTRSTRVFAGIDEQSADTQYSGEYQGHFVKAATVQVLSVELDQNGDAWYQVRYLYGDDFTDGTLKWTDYGTAWIRADETGEASSDSCTVTDFAWTLEYLRMNRSSGRGMLKAATPMNGFTLKNINGSIGGFYEWQSGLYGSSGHDSEYPQIAKSPSHGIVYATPHYLEGFTVFCLEHKLSGPGEGSGSNQQPKGPYVLVDMDTFVNDPSYGGTTGVRYKASTMHALAWVLRHTYPFMALNRSDANNEVWSRVAGQFAMREVIKQLEGAQYVRDYWDMDNFYSFTGGAPAVYLTYARWLAENGIAHARITGDIYASNMSTSISGNQYIGTVTLRTDADLIRIPKIASQTLTGNTGGSDSSYYYAKSGDTIRVASSRSKFTVDMESVASDAEEANFLVGVPSVSIQKIMVPLYGHPYPLKSATVVFELSQGEIQVTKTMTDGTPLKGAVFELLDSTGIVIATASTNANGIAAFTGLQPGKYTVREKTPPQGFQLSAKPSQDVVVTAGTTSSVTFANKSILGKIRIMKTDTVTGEPLAGAVFTITRLSGPDSYDVTNIGKVVAVITTDENGIAETSWLVWGEYQVTESKVPEGYIDSGFTTTVKIN